MRALALAFLLAAAPAGAGTIVLDFEEEELGNRGESFLSAECGCVRLTALDSPVGTEERLLTVLEFDGSRALAIGDEGSALLLEFLLPVISVRLDFGHGHPRVPEIPGQPVILITLAGGEVLSWDSEVADDDMAIDQTLGVAKYVAGYRVQIDSAYFDGTQRGESEPEVAIIDRIVLETTDVPEPASLGLIALGAALAARRRSQVRAPNYGNTT